MNQMDNPDEEEHLPQVQCGPDPLRKTGSNRSGPVTKLRSTPRLLDISRRRSVEDTVEEPDVGGADLGSAPLGVQTGYILYRTC
jgi:hypothetical protein